MTEHQDTEQAPTAAAESETTELPPAQAVELAQAWSVDDGSDYDTTKVEPPHRGNPLVWSALTALVVAIAGALIFLGTTYFGSHDSKPVEHSAKPTVRRPDSNRGGATGQCCDGSDTHAEHRTGACSHHGGVCQWFAAAGTRATPLPAISSAVAADIGNRPSPTRPRL